MAGKLVLIDGHSILHRAFYGVPDLTNAAGVHTNAVYGFLNIMFKILDEETPDYLIVAFDMSAPTFRHKMYDAYKGTRKPMPEELRQQVPLIREVLDAMQIETVALEGYEADDLLGTIAKQSEQKGVEVSIVSGDRDILQIASDHIMVRIPKTKKGVTEIENYKTEEVLAAYGVTPSEFIDMKALMGDASDNIPGAPGIGEKTASAIIQKYKSIENAYAHIEEITPAKAKKSLADNYVQVQLSKKLATINVNVPIVYDLEAAGYGNMFNSDAYSLFKRCNFNSFLKRFDIQADNMPKVYSCVTAVSELQDAENIFAQLTKQKPEKLGFSLLAEDNRLLGMAIAVSDNSVYYFETAGFLTEAYLTEQLEGLIRAAGKAICCRLNTYLALRGRIEGIDICHSNLRDIELAAYLLNPVQDNYSYDELCKAYAGELVPGTGELLGKLSLSQAAFVDSNKLEKVAALESYACFTLWDTMEAQLDETGMLPLYQDVELPLAFILYDMHCNGIMADRAGLKEYGDKLAVQINRLEREIYSLAGREFNINSPKQLGVVLFEEMKLPSGKKTKSGYSTAADVLEKLAPDYEIVAKILEYRTMTKLKSTYADGLAVFIGRDERIHGNFNQTITATGRISSTEPNLQNIPIRMEIGRQIRKVFVPKPGYVFLDADYSQIELRILAHMSGDETLIAAYNSAQDIHAITASQVFHTPLEQVTKEQRSNAKAVNFGIIYGISSFGLSQDLSISQKEAKQYIEQYFAAYPHIKEFIDGLVESAKSKGYSETLYGRRRPIPELSSGNFMQRQFGERIAMNAPIQGTAADIIKIAMIKVYCALKEHNLKSRLILQVHDELLIEAAEDETEIVSSLLVENMKYAAQLKVALEVSVGEGKNWLEAH